MNDKNDKIDKIDKRLAAKISEFMMYDFRPYLKKNSDEKYFDGFSKFETIDLLAVILSEANDNYASGKGYFAEKGAGQLSRRTYKVLGPDGVGDRLRLLARYWFISCDCSRRVTKEDGKIERLPALIYPNPAFLTMFEPRQSVTRNNFKKLAVAYGDNREKNQQGLYITVKYGYPELANFKIEDLNAGEIIEKFQNKAAKKDEKAAENKLWRAYKVDFIQQAAKCWMEANARIGNPHTIPVWSDMGNTGSEVSKMRRDLTKMFEGMGGTVTALAWYVYTHGMPALKPDGSLVFDLKIPHRQFKGSDMKPSGFAKHFNAILLDHDFRCLAGPRWQQGKDFLLRHFSREILEVGPRDGKHYADKLGYVLGDNPISNPPTENV